MKSKVKSGANAPTGSWLQPTGQQIESFFGASKTHNQANKAFGQLTSMMQDALKLREEWIKNPSAFIEKKQAKSTQMPNAMNSKLSARRDTMIKNVQGGMDKWQKLVQKSMSAIHSKFEKSTAV